MTTTTINDEGVAQQVDAVITGARCTQSETGTWCHVFLDGGTRCQCGGIDLMKERMG